MSWRSHAFVDWDDTLAGCREIFVAADQANAALVADSLSLPVERVLQVAQDAQHALHARLGACEDDFARAWQEAYSALCTAAGRTPDIALQNKLWHDSRAAYTAPQPLAEGAAEFLHDLRTAGFEVIIWSCAHRKTQEGRIARSGLAGLVHRVVIVSRKDATALEGALGGLDRNRCCVVGNSAASDILPALACRVTAIHIPKETWALDRATLPVHPLYHEAPDLQAARRLIEGLFPPQEKTAAP